MLNQGFADEASDKHGTPWAVLLSEKLLDRFYTPEKNSNGRLQMIGLTPSPEQVQTEKAWKPPYLGISKENILDFPKHVQNTQLSHFI